MYSTSETLYQRVRRQSAQRVRRRKGARRVFQRRPGACNCVGDAPAHAPHWPADGRQPFRSAPRRAIAARRLSIGATRAGWRRGRQALLTERCAPRRGDAHSGVPSPAVPARNPNPISARQTNTGRRSAPARRAAPRSTLAADSSTLQKGGDVEEDEERGRGLARGRELGLQVARRARRPRHRLTAGDSAPSR